MKPMLNLYLLGVVLTLLSIFVRLMESLGGILESPLLGTPKGIPDHPSREV
ncbi:unnamed protein product [Nyctereutes procyonoides]|uniref:(raccoon dog) hypothetical protein n=1 Tax=Nyctereutes procyonoides TaxID=34880 RepID=A0A811ZNQ4_NYCPR|nr:unnamed protein product [Nyctereutes procyonoides]